MKYSLFIKYFLLRVSHIKFLCNNLLFLLLLVSKLFIFRRYLNKESKVQYNYEESKNAHAKSNSHTLNNASRLLSNVFFPFQGISLHLLKRRMENICNETRHNECLFIFQFNKNVFNINMLVLE